MKVNGFEVTINEDGEIEIQQDKDYHENIIKLTIEEAGLLVNFIMKQEK